MCGRVVLSSSDQHDFRTTGGYQSSLAGERERRRGGRPLICPIVVYLGEVALSDALHVIHRKSQADEAGVYSFSRDISVGWKCSCDMQVAIGYICVSTGLVVPC